MRQIFRHILFAALLPLAISPILRAEETVTDSKFGFSFKVPDPFFKLDDNPEQPDTLYSYADKNPEPAEPATVIQVQRLRGVVDPDEHLKASDIPATEGVTTTLEMLTWQDRKLDVIRQIIQQPESPAMVGYTVQMPLQKEAVQIVVGGPVGKDADIRKVFHATAADFKNLKPLYSRAKSAVKKTGSLSTEPIPEDERWKLMLTGIFKMTITVLVVAIFVQAIAKKLRKPNGQP